jgi:serine protease Do
MGAVKRLAARWPTVLAWALAGLAQAGQAGGIEGLAQLDFREVIKKAKDKVFPALIFIKAIREGHEAGKKLSHEVVGSGAIISPKGEALTNWHVVDRATEVRCLLLDGRAMAAKVLGSDKDSDLALLQLQVPADSPPLPHAVLGDSGHLKEGDFVMAMGAPWGLARSVSIGVVSCTRRYLPGRSEYSLWLQTDASISPGNSGGPLVNTDGEVVGINAIGSRLGGDLGFAIPSDTVKVLLPRLREQGRVKWSWTGLQLQPLRDFERNMYFAGTEGVMVSGTDPESPARRAGFLSSDRIVKVNGKPVAGVTEEDLPAIRQGLGLLPKGEAARFELVRNSQALTIELKPTDKGEVEGEELDCPRWDLTLKAINQFDTPSLYFHRQKGVFIFGVQYPGNAQAANLMRGDILLSIDGKEVTTLAEAAAIHKEALANVQKKHKVVISVLRNGLMRQVVLDFSRDSEKE